MKNILILFLCLSFIACKKENPKVEEEANTDPASPVSVLKDNSGFSAVFDEVQYLSSANAAAPSMGIADFTVEANENLNIAFYSMQPSQQDPRYQFKRVTKNLKTGQIVPLPQFSDDLSSYSYTALKQRSREVVLEMFKPYSNFFTYATYYRQQFSNGVDFYGDITSTVATANPIGTPDMAYYYPAMNMEGVNINDNGFSYFTLGVPSPTYQLSVSNPISYSVNNRSGKVYLKTLLEPRYAAQGNNMAFRLTTDSLLAYKVNINNILQHELLDKVGITGFAAKNAITTVRHYSLDGKKLGMLFKDEVTGKYSTVAYDFATNKLTRGLHNVSLPYSAAGSDIDLDEDGNIYYTGIAGNGANTAGVSIYKMTVSGSTILIGADNFLKFGEIIKLKVLMGKVYFALKGKKTGLSYYQLSILKQD